MITALRARVLQQATWSSMQQRLAEVDFTICWFCRIFCPYNSYTLRHNVTHSPFKLFIIITSCMILNAANCFGGDFHKVTSSCHTLIRFCCLFYAVCQMFSHLLILPDYRPQSKFIWFCPTLSSSYCMIPITPSHYLLTVRHCHMIHGKWLFFKATSTLSREDSSPRASRTLTPIIGNYDN